jgi:hypothetical protein
VHVQDGSFLTQSDDTGDLQAGEMRVSSATTFTGNGSNTGSDPVPLPKVMTAP